jgi:hypothetical protein
MKITQESYNKYKAYLKVKEQEEQQFTKEDKKMFQKIENVLDAKSDIKRTAIFGLAFIVLAIGQGVTQVCKNKFDIALIVVPLIFGLSNFIEIAIAKYRYNKYKNILG